MRFRISRETTINPSTDPKDYNNLQAYYKRTFKNTGIDVKHPFFEN